MTDWNELFKKYMEQRAEETQGNMQNLENEKCINNLIFGSDDDWENKRDALEASLPTSWVDESGTRHAVIYDEGDEWRIKLEGDKAVIVPPF